MDLALTEEQEMVQRVAREFATKEVLPQAAENDRAHRFPAELVKRMAELGFLGIAVPEEWGGAGMDNIAYVLVMEEISRACAGTGVIMSVANSLACDPVLKFGTDEQKQKYLPRMARGELIGCFGLTEPHGGSDPANMKTHAKRRGGDWVINGAKMWITNGAIADLCVCWAQTDEGIRGFIVEAGTAGFSAPEIEHKFSLRASVTSALFFDNVVVPAANVLPGVVGLKGPLSCLTQARFGITWGVIGAAQACLAQLIDYTKDRVLFGRPLAANQTIQVRLAEMSRKITLAQLLSLRLGRLKDAGRMTPSQVSLAKWNNCRAAIEVARDARDMLGGAGISAEYVPVRHMLNLESVITYEGTETIHQLSVGRELTGISAF